MAFPSDENMEDEEEDEEEAEEEEEDGEGGEDNENGEGNDLFMADKEEVSILFLITARFYNTNETVGVVSSLYY